MKMKDRFRGYLPVVLDLETGGFDSRCNPILELACAFVSMESDQLQICEEFCWAVSPFSGAIIEESSLKITGINLDDPDRIQMEEKAAIPEPRAARRTKAQTHFRESTKKDMGRYFDFL